AARRFGACCSLFRGTVPRFVPDASPNARGGIQVPSECSRAPAGSYCLPEGLRVEASERGLEFGYRSWELSGASDRSNGLETPLPHTPAGAFRFRAPFRTDLPGLAGAPCFLARALPDAS